MPLDQRSIQALPLILESDILSLSPHFKVEGTQLIDLPLQASHTVHAPGDMLLSHLADGVQYKELSKVCRQVDVNQLQLLELLGFVNSIGGLVRIRKQRAWLLASRTHVLHLLLGIRYRRVCWRRHASLFWLGVGSLRATMPVLLAAGMIAGLAWAAGIAPPSLITSVTIGSVGLFVVSIVGHEAAHVFVLRHHGLAANVLQMGMHIGIIHRKPRPSVEILSSLVGPLFGSVLCFVAGLIASATNKMAVALAASMLALLHLLSLLPFYGDGLSLKRALHERRKTQ